MPADVPRSIPPRPTEDQRRGHELEVRRLERKREPSLLRHRDSYVFPSSPSFPLLESSLQLLTHFCSSPFHTGDPWREATVSADGIFVPSTSQQPIVESDGFHCSDLITGNAVVDATVKNVQTRALASMHTWMAQYRAQHGIRLQGREEESERRSAKWVM